MRRLVDARSKGGAVKKVLAAVSLGIAAIGAGTAGGVALAGSEGKSTLKVTVKEMRIIPAAKQLPNGKVTFVVRNAGSIVHEMVVVRAQGRSKLGVREYKAVETGAVGEVEDVEPGKTKSVTLKLTRGTYFLICNEPGHYQLGMRATLRVT